MISAARFSKDWGPGLVQAPAEGLKGLPPATATFLVKAGLPNGLAIGVSALTRARGSASIWRMLASGGPGDPMAEVVSREGSLPLSNSYARFRRFGLALRNPLSATLQRGGRLSDLLGTACSIWKGLGGDSRAAPP